MEVDVGKPLIRRMKIKASEGDWLWIYFKYERLPSFCYSGGKLGHVEDDTN